MPDDVGGQPFADGEEPEYRHSTDRDEEFHTVVLDEDFVRSAEVHEPSAAERAAAAAARSGEDDAGTGFDPSAHGTYVDLTDLTGPGVRHDPPGPADVGPGLPGGAPFGTGSAFGAPQPRAEASFPEAEPEHGSDHGYGHPPGGAAWRAHRPYGFDDGRAPYRGHVRWQRPVAWVLAVVMGIGIAALAVSAVYGGSGQETEDPAPPPASSGTEGASAQQEGAPEMSPSG